jgi:hypothetical protein
MNYLAHIFLSGENPNVMIGNFMADSIKGSKHDFYPPEIQKGILLHRKLIQQPMPILLLGKVPNGFTKTTVIIRGLLWIFFTIIF